MLSIFKNKIVTIKGYLKMVKDKLKENLTGFKVESQI